MIWSTPALRKAQVSSRSAVLAGITAKALEGVGAGGAGAGAMMVVWQEKSGYVITSKYVTLHYNGTATPVPRTSSRDIMGTTVAIS